MLETRAVADCFDRENDLLATFPPLNTNKSRSTTLTTKVQLSKYQDSSGAAFKDST